jgi:signal transduction histidine kinase
MTSSPRKPAALRSIRWRLTLSMSLLLLIAAGIGLTIVYRETSSQLSAQIDRDLRSDTNQFVQSLRIARDDEMSSVREEALRYVRAQPFRGNSTLLFLLQPGRPPISNYAEIFRPQPRDDDESASEQTVENREARAMAAPALGYHEHAVADVGTVRTLELSVRIGGSRLVIGAGQPLLPLARAQHGIAHSLIIAIAVIVLAVLAGANLIAGRITGHLSRMARVASRIDAGDLSSRITVPDDGRSEIGILAASFNHMLDRLERGMRIQREFVAEASHELRTPLTVIQGQVEVLANRPEVDHDDLQRVARVVRGETSRMRRIVDELLLLAQSERPDFLHLDAIDVRPFLEEIWDSATLLAERNFELVELPRGTLRCDPDRLAQALRNLINNAIAHTAAGTGTIWLTASVDAPGSLRIRIADNGPGIPPEELDRIFNRFHRLDRSTSDAAVPGGSGLGLSIVRAIVEAHRGHVRATNRSEGSGAVFEIVLPRFVAARALASTT